MNRRGRRVLLGVRGLFYLGERGREEYSLNSQVWFRLLAP